MKFVTNQTRKHFVLKFVAFADGRVGSGSGPDMFFKV